MKAVEFKTRMKNQSIKVPERLKLVLSENKNVRVIVLFEDEENQEENSFKTIANEQFLAGYSESDSIYDSY